MPIYITNLLGSVLTYIFLFYHNRLIFTWCLKYSFHLSDSVIYTLFLFLSAKKTLQAKEKSSIGYRLFALGTHVYESDKTFVCQVGGGTKSFLYHDIKAARRWKSIFLHHKQYLHIVIFQESFI